MKNSASGFWADLWGNHDTRIVISGIFKMTNESSTFHVICGTSPGVCTRVYVLRGVVWLLALWVWVGYGLARYGGSAS